MTRQALSGCVLIVFSVFATAEGAHRHGSWRYGYAHRPSYASVWVSPPGYCDETAASTTVAPPRSVEEASASRRPSWVLSDEDLFLDPAKGRAALHVDVPWDADVKIEYVKADGGAVSHWTLSRGKHRNFLLEHLPTTRDRLVRVDIHVRGRNSDGSSYDREKVKSKRVFVLAGDRRYLDFVQDWKAEQEVKGEAKGEVEESIPAPAPMNDEAQ